MRASNESRLSSDTSLAEPRLRLHQRGKPADVLGQCVETSTQQGDDGVVQAYQFPQTGAEVHRQGAGSDA